MSATSIPITPLAFAAAIKDLPLGNLHLKAAELQNSINHLRYSNAQLQAVADDDDSEDCHQAIQENQAVIGRMEERVALLRAEVERRGYCWPEAEAGDRVQDGAPADTGVEMDMQEDTSSSTSSPPANGMAAEREHRNKAFQQLRPSARAGDDIRASCAQQPAQHLKRIQADIGGKTRHAGAQEDNEELDLSPHFLGGYDAEELQ
ncbi:MAG: hypothetical protein M1826_005980 [Phylliscum demangeonii]|nr:MAG: hypothetical protein M1826_005980 [Phylliscum demangeonii]